MKRKIKARPARKVKRNPMARELAGGQYRGRTVPRFGAYRRREKHPQPPGEEGQ